MICNNSHNEIKADAQYCGNCGAKIISAATSSESPATTQVTEAAEPTHADTPAPSQNQTVKTAYAVARQPQSGLSIASLVLGILAVLSLIIWFVAIPLGLLAFIFGLVGRSKGGKGKATAGIVLSIIAVVGSILLTAYAIDYAAKHPNAFSDTPRQSDGAQLFRPLQ